MSEQDNHHSREDSGKNPAELNYASVGSVSPHRRIPISGIISFVAMLVQIPWSFPALQFLAMDYNPGPAGVYVPPTLSEKFVVWVIALLPAFVGLICGGYSMKVAGIRRRNILGTFGLIISASFLVFIVVGACLK